MKLRKLKLKYASKLFMGIALTISVNLLNAQSYTNWYNSAQERIDTIRKGDFGIKIFNSNGQAYTGDVSVRLKKHEFPFGISFDLYDKTEQGNTYATEEAVDAEFDAVIYQSERWGEYLEYTIPVKKDQECTVNLKFAEIYFEEAGQRAFNVNVNGEIFLEDFDIYAEAGGKNIAKDTALTFMPSNGELKIEFIKSLDNAAIKGIEVDQVSSTCIKINCGGSTVTTSGGNRYVSDSEFIGEKIETVATKEDWMQAAAFKYFNYAVNGNSFKWSGIQPRHTEPDYSDFDNLVRWTQKVGWDLRAHTLLWGADNDHEMPAWVRELETPQAIYDTCKMRVQREVKRYKGIVKEYDVINEPLTGHADWLRNTVGDSIIWNSFKWAHEVDPNAELYINDYNVELNWGQAEEYRDLVLQILENGGPITGIGIQAHFWDCCPPNVDEIVKNFNILAETGLPLRLTEFDWGTDLTEKQQVNDFMKVITIAFSHPSVNGMICWGLNDEDVWRDNTGFFNADKSPKLAADTLLYLTKTKWTTNVSNEINDENPFYFNAYYGDYEIEVVENGVSKVFIIPCLQTNEDSVFELNIADAFVKGPQLMRADLEGDGAIKLVFNKAIDANTVRKDDFKFFSNYPISIDEIQIDESNPEMLYIVLNQDVTKGDYISVSYLPGELKGKEGGIVQPFGPEGIANEKEDSGVSIEQPLISEGIKLYPNPANEFITIENIETQYQVELVNNLGKMVFKDFSKNNSYLMDLNEYNSGVYLLKIVSKDNTVQLLKFVKN